LFLIDEPTVGLHAVDVVNLIACFRNLLSIGHSLIVVEHDLQVIRSADHVIDLGPGAGASGGQIVATGSPQEISAAKDSLTGQSLQSNLSPNGDSTSQQHGND
jgi:excinuclease ABC subunit A